MTPRQRLYAAYQRWALRGPAPEAWPVQLDQRRIYVLPTAAGLAYGCTLLLMLVASINYNLSLGYALVFLLVAIGLLAILQAYRNLVNLRLVSGQCASVFAGQAACLTLVLQNDRAEVRAAIEARLPGQAALDFELAASRQTAVQIPLATSRRGWLPMPRLTLATRWPLGLVRAWGYAEPELRCLVYPAPASAAPPLPRAPLLQRGRASRVTMAEGQDDFAGLRRHQPADPPGHIAWKLAARTEHGSLQSKRFQAESADELWLRWQDLPEATESERRLAILCRWVCQAHAAGLAWGLELPQTRLKPAHGTAHYQHCLRQLALYGQN